MSNLLDGVTVNYQSSIRMQSSKKVIYFDPYKVKDESNDADVIFITHDHYDHFSPEDIAKVRKDTTVVVAPERMQKQILELGFDEKKVVCVKPGIVKDLSGLIIETIPAYNLLKKYHLKRSGWVGYLITLDDRKYYVTGDIDAIKEAKNVRCDVAFVPIGGNYTMNVKEAAGLVNTMRPDIVVPIHYGCICGKPEDAEEFKKLLIPSVRCKFLLDFETEQSIEV